MNYLIGMKQDLVFAFCQKYKAKHSLNLLAFEDIKSVNIDYNQFLLNSITTSYGTIFFSKFDRIYLRPYSIFSAFENDLINEYQLSEFQKINNKLRLARQITLGNVETRNESNQNKLLHCLRYGLDLEQKIELVDESLKANDEYVIKSPSSVRVEVQLQSQFKSKISKQTSYYVIRQKAIIGHPIRVHVVDQKDIYTTIFPKPESNIDYRYDNKTKAAAQDIGKSFNLPSELFNRCLSISKLYNLPLVGIDFLKDEDDFYFLEVNPEPGWAYVPLTQCFDIVTAIVKYLNQSKLDDLREEKTSFNLKNTLKAELISSKAPFTLEFFPQELQPTDYIAKPGEEHPYYAKEDCP